MRNQILEEIKEAMKSQKKFELGVLRMVKGAMQLEEINKKRELTDEEVIGIIEKQIKTRRESILEFEKGNRTDLIEATQKEIDFLSTYMPEQLTVEELEQVINQVIEEVKPASIKEMGKVMAALTPLVKGKADMSTVSKMIRERLS